MKKNLMFRRSKIYANKKRKKLENEGVMLLIPERVLKTQSKPNFGEHKQIEMTNKRFAGWRIDSANIYFLLFSRKVCESRVSSND